MKPKVTSVKSLPYTKLTSQEQSKITRLDKSSLRKEYSSMAFIILLAAYGSLGIAGAFPDISIMPTISAILVAIVTVSFVLLMVSAQQDSQKIKSICSDWDDYKKSQLNAARKEYRNGYWIIRGFSLLAFVSILALVGSGLANPLLLFALVLIPLISLALKTEVLKDYNNYVQVTGKTPESNSFKILLGLTD